METPTLNYEPKPPPPPARERDDLAYILPMAVFLAFIWLGGKGTATEHGNTWYPWAYAARAVVVPGRAAPAVPSSPQRQQRTSRRESPPSSAG